MVYKGGIFIKFGHLYINLESVDFKVVKLICHGQVYQCILIVTFSICHFIEAKFINGSFLLLGRERLGDSHYRKALPPLDPCML